MERARRSIPTLSTNSFAPKRDRRSKRVDASSFIELDSSKTGLSAPELACLAGLQGAYGEDRVTVVVDACQLRCSTASLAAYHRWGWIVLLTGSKLIGGPPFSGAVMLPARMKQSIPRLEGFNCVDAPSPGVLLRWRAALYEWRAFAAISEVRKKEIVEVFATSARRLIQKHSGLVAVLGGPGERADSETGWEATPTIFTFAVATLPGVKSLRMEELRHLYFRLLAAEHDRPAIRIGQPVKLGDAGKAGLRIALDARIICEVAATTSRAHYDASLRKVEGRLDFILDQIERLGRKRFGH